MYDEKPLSLKRGRAKQPEGKRCIIHRKTLTVLIDLKQCVDKFLWLSIQIVIFTIAGAIKNSQIFQKLQNECVVITVNLPHPSVNADLVLQLIYFQAITVFFARKTENGFLHKRSMRYLQNV